MKKNCFKNPKCLKQFLPFKWDRVTYFISEEKYTAVLLPPTHRGQKGRKKGKYET